MVIHTCDGNIWEAESLPINSGQFQQHSDSLYQRDKNNSSNNKNKQTLTCLRNRSIS